VGETREVDYGNWVSLRIILVPLLAGIVFLALSILFWPALILAIILLMMSSYFVYARYSFSPRGGDVQRNIRELVLKHLDWPGEGRALDIGCGNGALTIMCAKAYKNATVTGIDYWGKNWEYSLEACERNSEIEGVSDRVCFLKASASSLPFEDKSFDAVVSNLTFHEVRDTKDKVELIREALRVLREGGSFSFQDLFLLERTYGDVDDLLAKIKTWGVTEVEFFETNRSDFIPSALKLPFMVGTIGVIAGKK
jgi:ubiquinone/menaquinone biosynthesis C-methylase UbiE